ncbi:MAG: hypothetical protein KJP07_20775 [Desulfatitalea sp.]|nr:hypothetical protein [Desulfatitalea sp.]
MKETGKIVKGTRERDESGFWKIDKLTRLPMPLSPNEIQEMPWLNDEEKAIGVKLLTTPPKLDLGIFKNELPIQAKIWWCMPSRCLMNDPEHAVAVNQYYDHLTKLVTGLDGYDEIMQATTSKKGIDATAKRDDPDIRRRLGNALLITLAVTAEIDDQYMLRMMTTTPTETSPDDNGSYFMSAEKVAMLRHPDSSVWTDEEGLVLEFTYAVMRSEMSDGLWERAETAWGPKETMRYISWIGIYVYEVMFMAALSRRKVW